MKKQKSFYPTPKDIDHSWYLIDATDQILGRLATRIASIVRGKEKANYTPGVDTGDFVVVINAEKVKVTGNKELKKRYYRHTGYPGGLKETVYKEVMEKNPAFILTNAVKGMLPHNTYGRKLLKKVKIYVGNEHPHSAQEPQSVEVL